MISKKGDPGTSDSDCLHPDRLTYVQRHTRVLKMQKKSNKESLEEV